MMGATAAMAEPPQIAVPTPIRVLRRLPSFSQRPSSQAVRKATLRVTSVTARDEAPVFMTWPRLRPKPRPMMDHFNTWRLQKTTPGMKTGDRPSTLRQAMPSRMPNTGPPMSGNMAPSSQAARPRPAASSRPYHSEGVREEPWDRACAAGRPAADGKGCGTAEMGSMLKNHGRKETEGHSRDEL